MKMDEHPGPSVRALRRCIAILVHLKPGDERYNGSRDLNVTICEALGYEASPNGKRGVRIRAPGEPAYWTPPNLTGSLDDAARWLLPDGCMVIPRRPMDLCAMALKRMADKLEGKTVCRECGCTDESACPGGCSWDEPDLCSACTAFAF